MRRSWWTAVGSRSLSRVAGRDVAPPDLRRPLEALPAGAQAVLLTSDLRNTWQRVEAHDLRAVLENWPAPSKVMQRLRRRALRRGLPRLRNQDRHPFARRLGAQPRGQPRRARRVSAAGAAAQVGGDSTARATQTWLLVAELHDPARFRAALAALARRSADGPTVREEAFDGAPAWRARRPERPLAPRRAEGQLRGRGHRRRIGCAQALALHAGPAAQAALRDSVLHTALRAIGPHNVVGIAVAGRGRLVRARLHLGSVRTALRSDRVRGARRRAAGAASAHPAPEIWASIPDGMTCAALRRGTATGTARTRPVAAHRRRAGCPGGTSRVGRHARPCPMLPDLSRPWVGRCVRRRAARRRADALAPVPDVAFILQVRDAAAAAADLRSLETSLRGIPRRRHAGAASRMCTTAAGPIAAWCSRCRETVSPSWIVDGDVAVVDTTRTLMQQILDTRRTGQRGIRSDASFARFKTFVPQDAAAVFYADQRRLHHVGGAARASRVRCGGRRWRRASILSSGCRACSSTSRRARRTSRTMTAR